MKLRPLGATNVMGGKDNCSTRSSRKDTLRAMTLGNLQPTYKPPSAKRVLLISPNGRHKSSNDLRGSATPNLASPSYHTHFYYTLDTLAVTTASK